MLLLSYKISAAEADISNMQSKLIPPKREKQNVFTFTFNRKLIKSKQKSSLIVMYSFSSNFIQLSFQKKIIPSAFRNESLLKVLQIGHRDGYLFLAASRSEGQVS